MKVLKITVDNVDECLFFYTDDGRVIPVGYSTCERNSPDFTEYVEDIKSFIEDGYEYISMGLEKIGPTEGHEILFQISLH